jgi:hypothetical protein
MNSYTYQHSGPNACRQHGLRSVRGFEHKVFVDQEGLLERREMVLAQPAQPKGIVSYLELGTTGTDLNDETAEVRS